MNENYPSDDSETSEIIETTEAEVITEDSSNSSSSILPFKSGNSSNEPKWVFYLKLVLPLVLAIISFFLIARYATDINFYSKTTEILDNSKKEVLELMGGSTAASAALTVLPGDIATPIAEELASVSSYFMIVLAALYAERFLLTVIGFAAFKIFIPAACILFFINIFLKKDMLMYLSRRLFVFGVAIFLIIPTSTKISGMINDAYGTNISQITQEAKDASKAVESQANASQSTEEENWFSSLISSAKNAVSQTVDKMENVLNKLLDALAVMIVTSCVIPIVIIIIFIWLIKMIFNLNIDMKTPKYLTRKKKI